MAAQTDREREFDIYKVTIVGAVMNFVLVSFKFVAGFAGNSAAMIADAVHSMSDFVTDIVVIVFVRISSKPKDRNHHYGHGKFETFASLIIGFVLLAAGLGIAWNGFSNILVIVGGETLQSPGVFALVAALVSIVLKEILYRYTVIRGKRLQSDVVVANAWHHRSDALSSIGTAVGIGGAIFLGDRWTVLDPLAAMTVSVFIVITAVKLIKPCIDELLERSLPEEIEKEITSIAMSFDGVSDLHNLHTRKLGNNCAIEFHIRMDGQAALAETHERVSKIERRLKECYGQKTHVVIHLEPSKTARLE